MWTTQSLNMLSLFQLKEFEAHYCELLHQIQTTSASTSASATGKMVITDEILQILDERDQIVCRINQIERENLLKMNENKRKQQNGIGIGIGIGTKEKKKISLITPALQLNERELYCGYSVNNPDNKYIQKECGCLNMCYAHATFPTLKLYDLCANHRYLALFSGQYPMMEESKVIFPPSSPPHSSCVLDDGKYTNVDAATAAAAATAY